jgi:hypothetical protein
MELGIESKCDHPCRAGFGEHENKSSHDDAPADATNANRKQDFMLFTEPQVIFE